MNLQLQSLLLPLAVAGVGAAVLALLHLLKVQPPRRVVATTMFWIHSSRDERRRVLFLAREFPTARVRGVDRSAETIRKAVARVGLDPEGRVAFKHGGPRSLPYPDGFFDLVVQSSGRLHAAEIARVLRPGGHLPLIGSPRLPRRRLNRHGIAPRETGEAGGKHFHLARRAGGD